MDINKIKRTGQPISYGVASVSGGSGGAAGDPFRGQLNSQMKEDYKKRAKVLFDELSYLAENLTGRIDISRFEKYRGMIKELLAEIVKNAYVLSSEYITDNRGRQRVFETIKVIDEKLDALAKDLLYHSSDNLDYMSRVDEVRGLIMDMML